MAEIQVKKGNKQAPGCRHFMSDWDSHNYCPSCRDKGKGDDVCVKEKPEDCYIYLQFSSEQLKKLKARKIQRKAKENNNISKELEDSLLGTDSVSSETSGSNIQSSTSNSSSDPLQLILAKLESMQGRISSLERSATNVKSTTTSAVSSEIHTAEAVNAEEQDGVQDRFHGRHHTRTDEEELETGKDMEYRALSKRHRSPSPSTAVHQKDEEVEEDPTYRQFLATVRAVLDLPTLEDTMEVPSKIFSSRVRGKKRPSLLPMSLPPMEELNDRWKALENKAAGNPQLQDSDKLQSSNLRGHTIVVVPLLVVPTLLHQERILFGVNSSLSSSRSPLTPSAVEGEVIGSDYMMPSPGGRLLSFYKVWLENGCHPRVVHILQWGYHFAKSNRIVETSHNSLWVHESRETEILARLCSSTVKKKSHCTSKNVQDSGILQQVVFSSKIREKMETGYRSKSAKQLCFGSYVKNGNSRGNFAKGSSHTECNSGQPFTQGQNHTDRMVYSSQNFSDDLPNLAQASCRYVCNKNEQQATVLCVPSPRSKCHGSRCIEYLVGGGTRQLCLLSNSSHTKND